MVDQLLTSTPDGVDETDFDAACAAIRSYCGWHIAPSASETVTVDGSGSTSQLLPTLRLTALTSITNDGEPILDPEWSEAGFVRSGYYCTWSCKLRSVVADITHGYDQCPLEVAQVAKALALRMGDSTAGGQVRQVGQVAYQIPSGDGGGAELLESEKRVLDRYKLPPRP